MLSLKRGDPVALCTKGKSTLTVHIHGKDSFIKSKPDLTVPEAERIDLVPKTFLKEHKLTKQQLQSAMEAQTEVGQEAEELVDDSLRTRISLPDHEVFPIPQKFSERLYVSGPSGAGKSTFIAEYVKRLQERHKKRKVYIFSRVPEDPPLDQLKHVTRVPLEMAFWSWVTLRPEDFEKCVLLFDDIDTLQNKELLKKVRGFRDDCLEVGRHMEITCICATHLITNYNATRTVVNESQGVCLFPRGSSMHSVAKFLETYIGMGREKIREISELPTRWIWIWKEYPRYLVHQHGVMLI